MAPEPSSLEKPRVFSLMLRAVWLWLTLLTGASFVYTAQAQAPTAGDGWTVCNKTSFIAEAAIGRPDGSAVIVEGWLRLRPGECRVALPGPLEPGAHFLFARSSDAHRGGRREWGGEWSLCIDSLGSFSAESPPDCAAMGLEERGFRPVMIERRTRWRTDLDETSGYTLERARIAGLQRLLADAGVDEVKVDGFSGRRLSQAIGRFINQNKLDLDENAPTLPDVLEVAARRRAGSIGLTVCNRTRQPMWTAIARRRLEGWESRGWWRISPDSCMRPIDEPLIRSQHFVFAEMESDDGPRRLARAEADFCIGKSRFVVPGREKCAERGYTAAGFVAIEAPEREGQIVEFFERDFAPAAIPQQPNPQSGMNAGGSALEGGQRP